MQSEGMIEKIKGIIKKIQDSLEWSSFPETPHTEPKFSRNFRSIAKATFMIIFCLYGMNLFEGFVSDFHRPTLYVSELLNNHNLVENETERQIFLDNVRESFTYPGIKEVLSINLIKLYVFLLIDHFKIELKICPKTRARLTSLDNSINNYTIIPDETNVTNNDDNCWTPNFDTSLNVTDVNRILININFNNLAYDYLEVQFNSVYINSTSTNLTLNKYFITRGRHVIYEFVIKKRSFYSSYLFGLVGFGADNVIAIIEIDEKELPPIPDASYTILELKPKNSLIRYEVEKFRLTAPGLISNFGGFFSAVSALFALLFGASKHSPWGIFQTSCLCLPCRRRFKKELAKMYVSYAGIPLVDDPRELSNGATIGDRVAILEHLLKEYYLDTHYLEKLRMTGIKYKTLDKLARDMDRNKHTSRS